MEQFDLFAIERKLMGDQQDSLPQVNINNFNKTTRHIETGSDEFFKKLEKELPTIFSRQTASKALGGLISAKTMANADANKCGPEKKLRIGTKVGYEKDSFLRWLRGRFSY